MPKKNITYLEAIRKACLNCAEGNWNAVALCAHKEECPLWPWRTGANFGSKRYYERVSAAFNSDTPTSAEARKRTLAFYMEYQGRKMSLSEGADNTTEIKIKAHGHKVKEETPTTESTDEIDEAEETKAQATDDDEEENEQQYKLQF